MSSASSPSRCWGFIVSRYITGPITHLSGTMSQVSGGAYGLRAKTDRSDEIGELAKTFNVMMDKLEDARYTGRRFIWT